MPSLSRVKHHKFPLIPIFSYRKKNEWNPVYFGIRWLNSSWHTSISPDISIEISIRGTGIHTRINLPYSCLWTQWVIFPDKIEALSHKYLWRRGFNE